MNERIFELANEANKDIGYTFKMEEAKQLHELMEKFAELLIQKCADYAEYQLQIGGTNADKIKQHFGVK
jgi:DNA-binding ferritin-like protein